MGPKQFSDYIYKNKDDSIRVRVFRRDSGRWDFDVYHKDQAKFSTFSETEGDDFRTKAAALARAEELFSKMKSINPKDNWMGI